MITNYLQYTDALVNVKYADTFLNKYVADPADRNLVKKFLPQYNCGKVDEAQIRKQLRDKALAYLGFDPANLDPTDNDFYEKLLKASNPDNTGAAISEDGAILFNRSLAIVTLAESQRAVNQELIAPGKKVPISNDLDKNIKVSLDYLSGKINAAIKTIFDLVLPTSATTGKEGMASLVISAVGQIISQFGVAGAVVIQEQKTCIATPVFNPIVAPNPGTADLAITNAQIQACAADYRQCP